VNAGAFPPGHVSAELGQFHSVPRVKAHVQRHLYASVYFHGCLFCLLLYSSDVFFVFASMPAFYVFRCLVVFAYVLLSTCFKHIYWPLFVLHLRVTSFLPLVMCHRDPMDFSMSHHSGTGHKADWPIICSTPNDHSLCVSIRSCAPVLWRLRYCKCKKRVSEEADCHA
jgi:hypothetical protein